jgi:hypothetical protein
MKANDQLAKAARTIQERGNDYGAVEENWETAAQLWNACLRRKLKCDLSAADVALLLILLKVSRLANSPDHLDSQLDICGYSALMCEVV